MLGSREWTIWARVSVVSAKLLWSLLGTLIAFVTYVRTSLINYYFKYLHMLTTKPWE